MRRERVLKEAGSLHMQLERGQGSGTAALPQHPVSLPDPPPGLACQGQGWWHEGLKVPGTHLSLPVGPRSNPRMAVVMSAGSHTRSWRHREG